MSGLPSASVLDESVVGVFDADSLLFARYQARMIFRDKLIGGVPKDPKLIEGWLRARAGIQQEQELRQVMLQTLTELGVEVQADMSFEQLEQASAAVAARKQTTGFKRGTRGLYVGARQLKAMLKESTNVLFAGERWGVTKKGPKSFVAERIFVEPDQLPVGADEPSGVELMIGHLVGATGPRSTLGYHEYVEHASLEFRVVAMRDCLTREQWSDIWVHAQHNGFGALRSQGFGRFALVHWERLA